MLIIVKAASDCRTQLRPVDPCHDDRASTVRVIERVIIVLYYDELAVNMGVGAECERGED